MSPPVSPRAFSAEGLSNAALSSEHPSPIHRTLSQAVMRAGNPPAPSYLQSVVQRVSQEGSGILERLGLQPGKEASLPEGQRFRLDDATAQQWRVVAQRIGRVGMAVVVVSLFAAVLRMAMLLSPAIWTIWKVAGIASLIMGLVARHAELQLAAQLRASQAEQAAQSNASARAL